MPRFKFVIMLTAFLILPIAVEAQAVKNPQLYLTIFRNPSTGLELRFGSLAIHAGFYPTILKAEGEAEGKNTNFLRFGASVYSSPTGTGVYLSPSVVVSLDDRFKSGFLTDVGLRGRIAGPVAGRLGVGVLNTFDGQVRVNPTVGLDVRLGAKR